MPSEFDYALTQLNRLEAGHRRLRRRTAGLTALVVGQGVLLLYLLLPVGRLGVPKYVEASRFVRVDGGGRVRGELTMDEGPKLQLLTEKGQDRAVLWVNHDNMAIIMLMDNHPGSGRSTSVYAHDQETGIDFMDGKGTRVGFTQGGKQPELRKIDEPPPAQPNL